MTEEQINEIGRKLKELDRTMFLDFARSEDKDQWLIQNARTLEEDQDFTDKYKNINEFIGDKNKALAELYSSQNGEAPTMARLASFKKKHPDISDEEINEWFRKSNEYKSQYEAERTAEADKLLRAKEVKDLPWYKDMFVSDYSKQRYIDDPSTSILGGSKFNPYSSEGQKEIRDAILGATAGAVDFAPGVGGVVVGPLIRGGRDYIHQDEKYRPEGSIISNVLKDVGVNAGVEYLPTAIIRKANRAMGNMPMLENVLNARALEKETNDIRKSIQMFDTLPTEKASDLFVTIRKMPDSPMKSQLLAEIGEDWAQKGIDRKKITDIINSYAVATTPKVPESVKIAVDEGHRVEPRPGEQHAMAWLNKAAALPTPTRVERALIRGVDLASVVAPGAVKNATRPEVKIDRDKKEFNDSVDRIISNYSMLWSKNAKPQGYDTPLIKAAYDKWKEEND